MFNKSLRITETESQDCGDTSDSKSDSKSVSQGYSQGDKKDPNKLLKLSAFISQNRLNKNTVSLLLQFLTPECVAAMFAPVCHTTRAWAEEYYKDAFIKRFHLERRHISDPYGLEYQFSDPLRRERLSDLLQYGNDLMCMMFHGELPMTWRLAFHFARLIVEQNQRQATELQRRVPVAYARQGITTAEYRQMKSQDHNHEQSVLCDWLRWTLQFPKIVVAHNRTLRKAINKKDYKMLTYLSQHVCAKNICALIGLDWSMSD